MNKLFDLSFVIGCFFSVVGLLLVGYSIIKPVMESNRINLWCGVGFIVFGIVMILLSFRKNGDA